MTSPIGSQIRRLRQARAWTLAELAKRIGTSAPTLHRYESGWDQFRMGTLRKIAAALGVSLEIRLVDRSMPTPTPPIRARRLVRLLAPLFWDVRLTRELLDAHPDWVLGRVLTFGDPGQVAAARQFFGDPAIQRAVGRRDVDARTRNYWTLLLQESSHASKSAEP